MAVDPFNAVGGLTVGIPPVPILDANGNLTVPTANIGGVNISNNMVVGGTVEANLIIGTFQGNITGNLVVPGLTTQVIYNQGGNAAANAGFTFDANAQIVTVQEDFVANTITIGSGTNEFATNRVIMYTTNSSAPDQVLHRVLANTVCSMDYIIIATDATSNTRQTTKLFASVLGTDVEYFEVGTIDVPVSGLGVGDFRVRYNSGNVELTVQPVTSNSTTYKVMVTSYKE